jgi:hypothetical protein
MIAGSPSLWLPPSLASRRWPVHRRRRRPTGCRPFLDRIREIFWASAVQGKGQEDSDGKGLEDSDGKGLEDSATDETCCCKSGCNSCAALSDLGVSFGGIAICSCVDMGGYYDTLISNPNGTYTGFTKHTSGEPGYDCYFTKDITLTTHSYSDGGCTTPTGTTSTATIFVGRRISDGKWQVDIIITDHVGTDGVLAFRALTIADLSFSYSELTVTNLLNACGSQYLTDFSGYYTALGYGGEATIEFICA